MARELERQREPEKISPVGNGSSTEASHRLLADASPWSGPATDFKGHKRPHQPEEGKFPTFFETDRRGSHGSDKSDKDIAKYTTPEAHRDALSSLVHIHTPVSDGKIHAESNGSGTIIGHGKDVTYVATVDHNTQDHHEDPSALGNDGAPVFRDGPIKVQMPDGKEYEARRTTLKGEGVRSDRSVLVVHTGADTGNYHEANVADSPYKGPGFGVGFPFDSKSPYVSTINAKGDVTSSRQDIAHGARPHMTANSGHSEPGMSGGGMYTRDGKLYSMDEGNDKTNKVFDGVPIRKADVERWKKELPTTW